MGTSQLRIPHNPKNEGNLTHHGYHTNKSARARHRALAAAIKQYGAGKVWHELDALSKRQENQDPRVSETARADRNWVSRHYNWHLK